MEEQDLIFVNIKMSTELRDQLDEMVSDDDTDRSKFIRNLIRQEYERRRPPSPRKTNPRMHSMAGPVPTAA